MKEIERLKKWNYLEHSKRYVQIIGGEVNEKGIKKEEIDKIYVDLI
jgi:hypothetical protein